MKNSIKSAMIFLLGLVLFLPGTSMAMEHGSMGGMKMGGGSTMPMMRMGDTFHESTVDGYKLEYRLISMEAMMKKMPAMMKDADMTKMKTHHIMIYIAAADGMAVTEAKIGYMITSPDAAEQKVMAMAMNGGFGADIDLKPGSQYRIASKIVHNGKTLLDEFSYTLK